MNEINEFPPVEGCANSEADELCLQCGRCGRFENNARWCPLCNEACEAITREDINDIGCHGRCFECDEAEEA